MSKVAALYHLVFCTKHRAHTIPKEYQEDLYRFIWSDIRSHNSNLIRIGGFKNHLHIFLDLSPAIALSTLVRDIKANSSGWMRKDPRFPDFRGWAHEYFACSVSPNAKSGLIEYIKEQATHHTVYSFAEELETLVKRANLMIGEHDMME